MRRAWVEIFTARLAPYGISQVALHARAWVEMHTARPPSDRAAVALHARAWVEMPDVCVIYSK
mgnify:CR=1 FL=1